MAKSKKFCTLDFSVIHDNKRSSIDYWVLCDENEDLLEGYNIDTLMRTIMGKPIIYIMDLNVQSTYIINWLDESFARFILYSEIHSKINEDFYTVLRSSSGIVYEIVMQINSKRTVFRNAALKLVNNLSDLSKDIYNYTDIKDDKMLQTVNGISDLDKQKIVNYTYTLHAVLKWYLKYGCQITISGDVIKEWHRLDRSKAILYNPDKLSGFNEKMENDIRKAYRGGVCWTSKDVIDKDLGSGYIFDMNSIYLYVQYNYEMPYGVPTFTRFWDNNSYIVGEFYVNAKLKKNGIPCISDVSGINSCTNESLEVIEDLKIWMNKYDLEMLYKNYDVDSSTRFLGGWKFNTTKDVFKNFIDKWYPLKKKNNDNKALRAIAKAFAVNSYGKFGVKRKLVYARKDKRYYAVVDNDGNLIESRGRFGYVPVAQCITSIARYLIISWAHKCIESGDGRVVAIDTDAIHYIGKDIPTLMVLGEELGEFKIEAEFENIRHIGPKQYGYIDKQNNIVYKLSGASEEFKDKLMWDTFHIGTEINNVKDIQIKLNGGSIRGKVKYRIRGPRGCSLNVKG